MMTYLNLQKMCLQKDFLFDQIQLYVKFNSINVSLMTIPYSNKESNIERIIYNDVKIKIPSSRSTFTLILQVSIINMSIQPATILIHLSDLDQIHPNNYAYKFKTEMGSATAHIQYKSERILPNQTYINAHNHQAISKCRQKIKSYEISQFTINQQDNLEMVHNNNREYSSEKSYHNQFDQIHHQNRRYAQQKSDQFNHHATPNINLYHKNHRQDQCLDTNYTQNKTDTKISQQKCQNISENSSNISENSLNLPENSSNLSRRKESSNKRLQKRSQREDKCEKQDKKQQIYDYQYVCQQI